MKTSHTPSPPRLQTPVSPDGATMPSEGGDLVFIRSAVIDTVGHVLGNVFQRLYHLASRAKESDAVVAAELESSTARLEEYLKLLLDYVSPSRLRLQSIAASDVAHSLCAQLGDVLGTPPTWMDETRTGLSLLVDPSMLARSFSLMASQLRPQGRAQGGGVGGSAKSTEGGLLLTVRIASARLEGQSSEAEMQWVVAERLIEVQGGSLRANRDSPGEVVWEVTLPLQD